MARVLAAFTGFWHIHCAAPWCERDARNQPAATRGSVGKPVNHESAHSCLSVPSFPYSRPHPFLMLILFQGDGVGAPLSSRVRSGLGAGGRLFTPGGRCFEHAPGLQGLVSAMSQLGAVMLSRFCYTFMSDWSFCRVNVEPGSRYNDHVSDTAGGSTTPLKPFTRGARPAGRQPGRQVPAVRPKWL